MSKQAQVGLFTIVALLLLFGVFYVLENLSSRSGYEFAVHFDSAAGMQSGAQVLFSGVQVGSVERIDLLPDDSVDVVLAIDRQIGIPRDSRFLIQAPITGLPALLIIPPRGAPLPYATFPPGIVPVARQPRGENVATVQDLLQEGQGEIRRLDTILALLEQREPRLLASLQDVLGNVNHMTLSLRGSLGEAGENIAAMAATLNSTASLDAPKLNAMMTQLSAASVELRTSMASIESLATDPRLRSDVIATTENIAEATKTLAEAASDLRTVTSDPRTQEQIRDTIANLDATMQRAASLLGRLGGKSHVYGVDVGATPPPETLPSPPPAQPLSSSMRLLLGGSLAGLAHDLIELQLRVGYLETEHTCCSPLYPPQNGLETDLNAVFLPHSSTSFMLGANEAAGYTSLNLAALRNVTPNFSLGGGLLYSRLGVLGSYTVNGTGIDTWLYDPSHPALDLYGNVRVAPWAQVYFGERALNQAQRRSELGIQFHY